MKLFNALLDSAVGYTLIFIAAEYISRYYFALMLAMHSAIYDVRAEKKNFLCSGLVGKMLNCPGM